MVIRTLIVDDEPLARRRIRALLKSDAEIQIIGECGDGKTAVDTILNERPSLVFLDVQMPELDGLGVLEKLGSERVPPAVILVTAFDHYAVKAFEARALDYVLKPFNRARIKEAVQRAKEQIKRIEGSDLKDQLREIIKDLKIDQRAPDQIAVKTGGRVLLLKTNEIRWVEAAGDYVRLHVGKESYLIRETMNAMESRLNPDHFVRIHRSTIVNINEVKEVQPWFGSEYVVVLRDTTQLTLSRGYRGRLHTLLETSL